MFKIGKNLISEMNQTVIYNNNNIIFSFSKGKMHLRFRDVNSHLISHNDQ